MKRLYNLLFTVFFCLSASYYFLKMLRRGQWRQGFGQRFARYNSKIKQALTNRHVLWIHAVSVGEVNICTQLISEIERRLPNMKIVVSTTTSTGMAELQRKLPSHIQKVYYPIDRRAYVCRAILTLHPEAIVLVEAEIWPNFLWRAQELHIPVFLVNARLSARSYRGYRRFGFLFRPLFASLAGIGCQNENDAERLRELGCQPEAVRVVGNLKFDAAKLEERRVLDVRGLLRQLGMPESARLLIAGSTHAGEEQIIAEIFLRLRERFPDLYLILVPRHFERGKEVGRVLGAAGVKFAYRSEMSVNSRYKPGDVDCLLVNTTGELKYFYQHAAVIFVGKSLTAEGGQNPIEPAALAKPVIFGPNMQNFEAIAKSLVDAQGAIQVGDAAELETAIVTLLQNPDSAQALGRNAVAVVRQNLGGIERTVDMIVTNMEGSDIYVAPSREQVSAS
jgi:3-deoxy-D-manno-octulosonic-acid transferase